MGLYISTEKQNCIKKSEVMVSFPWTEPYCAGILGVFRSAQFMVHPEDQVNACIVNPNWGSVKHTSIRPLPENRQSFAGPLSMNFDLRLMGHWTHSILVLYLTRCGENSFLLPSGYRRTASSMCVFIWIVYLNSQEWWFSPELFCFILAFRLFDRWL